MSDYLFILAEKYIQEAQNDGKFDNLPGHGKPIDLTKLNALSSEFSILSRLFKKEKVYPREVHLLRQIAIFRKKLASQKEITLKEFKKLRAKLNEAQLELALKLENR